MDLAPGEMLGPYRLVEKVGVGGMAEVWRAHQPRLERSVAIKVLPRHLAAQRGYLERFRQEALTVSRLQHPHILPVFDFGEQDGFTYMVSPFIAGGTLADRLGGPWPAEAAARVLGPLAAALDHAHAQGVVHRDVKPSNVLLDEHGWLLLGDFGVARLVETTLPLTQAGAIIGTPAYMAPEQAEGRPATAASDRYALGVIAYEMLTGRPPFAAETPLAVALAHLHSPLPPPRAVNPALPEAVEAVLFKALAKDPDDRYPSGAALVAALAATTAAASDAATEPLPAPTRKTGPSETSAGASAPRRVPRVARAVLACSALVALLAVVAYVLPGALSPSATRPSRGAPSSIPITVAQEPRGAAPTATPVPEGIVVSVPTDTPDEPTPAASAPLPEPVATATLTEATATPAPLHQAGTTETPGVLFADTFDAPASVKLRLTGTQAALSPWRQAKDGQYVVTLPEGISGIARTNLLLSVEDSSLSVDARLSGDTQGRFIALACRSAPTGDPAGPLYSVLPGVSEYRAIMRPDVGSASIVRWKDKQEVSLSENTSPSLRVGNQMSRIEMVCRGKAIALHVNGQVLVSAEDEVHRRGDMWIGVGAMADKGPAEAWFDNLVVRRQ